MKKTVSYHIDFSVIMVLNYSCRHQIEDKIDNETLSDSQKFYASFIPCIMNLTISKSRFDIFNNLWF